MKVLASLPTDDSDRQPNPPEFSLVQGGLLFQVLRWAHLSADSPKANGRRVIVIALLAWMPLLLLSLLEGRARDRSVTVPFLKDIEAHVRLLGIPFRGFCCLHPKH
jgi:hypothetical protein